MAVEKNQFVMEEDEDYVVSEVEEDEEIDGLHEAVEDEFVPDAGEPDDDVLSDYADENESASEDEPDSDVEEVVGQKKKKNRRKNGKTDDWKPMTEEDLAVKPYKAADKYHKARAKIDQMCAYFSLTCSQSPLFTLKLTSCISLGYKQS